MYILFYYNELKHLSNYKKKLIKDFISSGERI